ncbi:hypothetical protein CPT_Mendera_255 [Stenotrophomonas phage Mendera]|uniref:Uncharacterized protein n=1 Tax=Stenotrophomonas phage Mendera TaxID=2650877 RepID=A0A5P8PJ73_9CAUD|nr:hypothetical protein HWC60_gp160 [Stenotrophomonas phage Mendera]QFR56781.1 hypothetical protein CPT_Mendera_255 [Stenotrophomonas phage Mendera]
MKRMLILTAVEVEVLQKTNRELTGYLNQAKENNFLSFRGAEHLDGQVNVFQVSRSLYDWTLSALASASYLHTAILASRAKPKKRLTTLLLSDVELEALILHAPVIMAILDPEFDGVGDDGTAHFSVEYHVHASVCAALDQLEKEGKL